MKKTIASVAFLSATLAFSVAHAQLATKKGITVEEITKSINEIAQKEGDDSKVQLEKEAKALAASKDERFVSLGARIYGFIGNETESQKISNSIVKKFPKGIKARQEAFATLFDNSNLTAATAEKQYQAWLKKFPKSAFNEKEQDIYSSALTKLAILNFKEKNTQKANQLITSIKDAPNFPLNAYAIASDLIKEKDYKNALPILEEAYNQLSDQKNPTVNRYKPSIASMYAKSLLEEGNTDKSIEVTEKNLAVVPYLSSNYEVISTLAQAYAKQGKDLDTFLIWEKFLIKNGKNENAIKAIEPLYNKLNNNKGNFTTYISNLEKEIKEASSAKYKSEMIKKEAPQFSLLDREGKTVSLADYKGKVVIIDFWATWCGPCKISFPGMQAAVNKYKDDKEVVFLFIDTWQREKNYKELVNEFIEKNQYTFHVLFDEMTDRAKATTTAYGVKGIPHKVVIDKEGFIRFESSGGSSDVDKIVSEMETKIELARKG